MTTDDVFAEILEERRYQDALRATGKIPATLAEGVLTDCQKLAVLSEEHGEVARATLNRVGLSQDKHPGELRDELIQLAACCVAWLEGLEVRS